jgi:hypothetical protein
VAASLQSLFPLSMPSWAGEVYTALGYVTKRYNTLSSLPPPSPCPQPFHIYTIAVTCPPTQQPRCSHMVGMMYYPSINLPAYIAERLKGNPTPLSLSPTFGPVYCPKALHKVVAIAIPAVSLTPLQAHPSNISGVSPSGVPV